MRQTLWTLCAISATQLLSVLAQGDTSCVPACEGNVRATFSTLGCADAADSTCLCASPSFLDGVTQCSTPCADQSQVIAYLNGAFCQTVPIAAPAASSSTSLVSSVSSVTLPASTSSVVSTSVEVTSSSAISSSTSLPATTSTSLSSSSSITSTSATSATLTSSATSQAVTTSSSAAATSSISSVASTTTTTTASSSVSQSAQATSSSTSSAKPDTDETSHASKGGLSHGAAIGIGIGCAAVVLVILILAFYLIRRRNANSQQSRRPPPTISKPIPGVGRTVASPDPGTYEKYGNEEFEMMTNRYEDMPPSQTPRTMV